MKELQCYDKFEYCLFPFSGYSATRQISELNNLGEKGWELTNIKFTDGNIEKYVLKRKITVSQIN